MKVKTIKMVKNNYYFDSNELLNIETIDLVKPYFTWLSTFTVMRIKLVIFN